MLQFYLIKLRRSNTAFFNFLPSFLPSSFYFVREPNGRALVVSILRKFIAQERLKNDSTRSENNSNNDIKQENHRQPIFIVPVVNSDNETGRKESG